MLNGYKSYIAGAASILYGACLYFGLLTDPAAASPATYVISGLGIIGIAHKLEKYGINLANLGK